MFNNKIAPAPARVMPARPNPAGNAGANQPQRQLAVVQPIAPIQVANGQMPANGIAAHASPSQLTSTTPSNASASLESKSMGRVTYDREVVKMSDTIIKLYVPDELMALLGDRTKVSLHWVHDDGLEKKGKGPYEFIGRDPSDGGRALVNVEVAPGRRAVLEVSFHFKALPLLAKEAHKAPKL